MAMTNQKLKTICADLKNAAVKGEIWLAENQKTPNIPSFCSSLRRSARHLQSCLDAAEKKMCIAFFGASQSGKSTVINSLGSSENGTMQIIFSRDDAPKPIKKDFNLEINAPGGSETTALVTRFSTENSSLSPYDGFPVKLNLLSHADIVKIIAGSYCNCVAPDELAGDSSEVMRRIILENLSKLKSVPPSSELPLMSLDAFESIMDYVIEFYKGTTFGDILEDIYWDEAAKLAPGLDSTELAKLLEPLWGMRSGFTKLYKTLYQALERLGFATEAYAELKAIAPVGPNPDNDDRRKDSILYIDQIYGIFKEKSDDNSIQLKTNHRELSLSKFVLCALVSELNLKVEPSPGLKFMEETDILDFPGYRSIDQSKNIEEFEKDPTWLAKVFLRSKVSYLFHNYCEQREATLLVLCVGGKTQEVTELPAAVNKWVLMFQGDSPEARANKPNYLFIALTHMDYQLAIDSALKNLEDPWKLRLQSSLTDFFGTWLCKEWTRSVTRGPRPFNNVYWMQNLDYARTFLKVSGTPLRAHGLTEDPVMLNWIKRMHEAYLTCPEVIKYFKYPEEAWKAIFEKPDGGTGYLIENLTPLCKSSLKTDQILEQVKREAKNILAILNPFFQSEEDGKNYEKKITFLAEKALPALRQMHENRKFGEFIRCLQVDENFCYNAFEQLKFRRDEYASLIGVDYSKAYYEIFDKKSGENDPHPPLDDKNSREANFMCSQLEKDWADHLQNLWRNFEIQRYYYMPYEVYQSLVMELQAGARNKALSDLENALCNCIRTSGIDRALYKSQFAAVAAAKLGEFINYLGRAPHLPEDQRTIKADRGERVIFRPQPDPGPCPALPETDDPKVINDLFDSNVPSTRYYVDWCYALRELCFENCNSGFVGYDHEKNQKLGEIILSINNSISLSSGE
jgi:hypothetical protein